MFKTDRPCPTHRCQGKLVEAVAQAGEHEGLWVEACFVCGSTTLLADQGAAAARYAEHEAGLARRRRRR